MKITKTSEGYALSQSHYIEKILDKFSKNDDHLWAPNVFWGGSEDVKCSLPRGKSHGEDGSSKPFMSEWEHDVVFGFVKWTFKE
ncbi:hypothetical protein CsSME_00042148 [Camellia sinensis var. sinensis]